MEQVFRKTAVVLICITLLFVIAQGIFASNASGDEERETRSYQLPVWETGDWWKYYLHSDEPQSLNSGGFHITIDEVTTVEVLTVAGSETVTVNGSSYDIYNVTIEGNIAQKGSYIYGQYSGAYAGNSESIGFAYYRRSDLAFIKRIDDITGTMTLAGQNSPYTSTVITLLEPPREDFNFPMSHLTTWNVNSLMTVNQSITSMGETESMEMHTLFNYIATVGAEDTGEVVGILMDFYPVHGIGTMVGDGGSSPFEVYNNYSSVVKNTIEGLIGFGDANSSPGSGDLTITPADFSVTPLSPRELVAVNISCNISNVGYGNVPYARVRAELDGDPFGDDIIIDIIESYSEYSIYYEIEPLSKGSHTFKIILDPDDLIEESDETNNHAVFNFEVTANREPVITGYQPFTNIIINKGTAAVFEIVAEDPDGDDIKYVWIVDGETVSETTGSDYEMTFTGFNEGDVILIMVVVYDDFDANVSHEWGVTINTAPTITSHTPLEQMITITENEEVGFVIVYDNAGVESVIFKWYLDGALLDLETSGFFTFESELSGLNSSESSPYEIKVVVEDLLNLSDEYTWTLVVNNKNQAPTIVNAMGGGVASELLTINETENMKFNITVSDPDSDPISYTWFLDGIEVTGAKAVNFIYSADHDTVTHVKGKRTCDIIIKVLADDGEYNDTYTWTLRVVDINRGPEIYFDESPDSVLSGIKEDEKAHFNVTSSDPDGDTLSYKWFLDGEIMTVDPSPTFVFKEGDHAILLVVDDGYGDIKKETFNFTVLPGESGMKPGGSGNTGDDLGGKGFPIWAIIAIVLVAVLVVIMVVILLLKRKKPAEKVSFEGIPKREDHSIFLCPKCNEKADWDLGYCVQCGDDFSDQK